jgi:Domain of unknown function (DUF4142)
MYAIALMLLFASDPQQELKQDVPQPKQQGTPTDPLFDKAYVATDEPAFVLSVIESARQGELDAKSAAETLSTPEVRDAAVRIGRQNGATRARLEILAKGKGWRTPAKNPERASTLPATGEARTEANFIVQQISFHEATVAQFRAQLDGSGDADLKRELREALPGYQKNLDLLLHLKL